MKYNYELIKLVIIFDYADEKIENKKRSPLYGLSVYFLFMIRYECYYFVPFIYFFYPFSLVLSSMSTCFSFDFVVSILQFYVLIAHKKKSTNCLSPFVLFHLSYLKSFHLTEHNNFQ